MDSSENWLLCLRMRALVTDLDALAPDAGDGAAAAIWRQMERSLEKAGAEEDADLALPVLECSRSEVQAVFDGWDNGSVHLPEWDKAVLKRALKAYRKRLKIMRLDDESSGSRNPLSKGEESSILGVRPPEQYPPEIWAFLVAQGKLSDVGGGLLELATS
jgi:hypothetical protein